MTDPSYDRLVEPFLREFAARHPRPTYGDHYTFAAICPNGASLVCTERTTGYSVHDSTNEAWGRFCAEAWDKARQEGAATLWMGSIDRGSHGFLWMHCRVPEPPNNMLLWTMLGAERVLKGDQ